LRKATLAPANEEVETAKDIVCDIFIKNFSALSLLFLGLCSCIPTQKKRSLLPHLHFSSHQRVRGNCPHEDKKKKKIFALSRAKKIQKKKK